MKMINVFCIIMFFLIHSLSFIIIFSWDRGVGGGELGEGTQRNGGEKCTAVGRGKTLYS